MQDAGEAVAAEQVTLSVTGRLASGTNAQILSHSLWTQYSPPLSGDDQLVTRSRKQKVEIEMKAVLG